jgi:thiol-disulfide isomerase/thioredoxin
MTPQTRRLAVAAFAAVLIGAVAAVLYVTRLGPVHEGATSRPSVLAKLRPAEKPAPIPAVAVADATGHLHKLTEFRGRYMLLNLWATWCAPCVRELPALAQLQKRLGPNGVSVVPVNVGHSTAAETAAFLASHSAGALPVYIDSSFAFLRAFRAYGLPVTVLVDPQGREVARVTGAVQWDAKDSVDYFKSLASKKSPS